MEGITQTAGLFRVGMIIGRSNVFLYSEKNIKIWLKVFIIAVTAFFPLYGLIDILPELYKQGGTTCTFYPSTEITFKYCIYRNHVCRGYTRLLPDKTETCPS